jgi:hypothetical protein
MSSQYFYYINNLKFKLKNKNIGFKKTFKLINNKDYDKILLINDLEIQKIINIIIDEREKIVINFENNLNNLEWLNVRLIEFNLESQESKKKALKILRNICINIYDLIDGLNEKQTTYVELIKDLRKNPERRFPLKIAKQHISIKCFLKKC